jgi:hypothetical protein
MGLQTSAKHRTKQESSMKAFILAITATAGLSLAGFTGQASAHHGGGHGSSCYRSSCCSSYCCPSYSCDYSCCPSYDYCCPSYSCDYSCYRPCYSSWNCYDSSYRSHNRSNFRSSSRRR